MAAIVAKRSRSLSNLIKPLINLKLKHGCAEARVLPVYFSARYNSQHRVVL